MSFKVKSVYVRRFMKGGKTLNALLSSAYGLINNNLFLLTTTATDVEGKARILGFDSQLLLQTAIHGATALALFIILGKLIFKPVNKILEKRKETIANEYQIIKIQTEKGNALIEDYEVKLTHIKKEADEILAEARKAALAHENKMLSEAKLEVDRIFARSKLEIEREKEKVKDDIKKEIIEVATLMASKFVAATMDEKTRSQLFDQAISEMGENTWQN